MTTPAQEARALVELAQKATNGPAEIYDGSSDYSKRPNCIGAPAGHVADCETDEDAAFIIACFNTAPRIAQALLDSIQEVERKTAVIMEINDEAVALHTKYQRVVEAARKMREPWQWSNEHRPDHRQCKWCRAVAATAGSDAPIPHAESCLWRALAELDAEKPR